MVAGQSVVFYGSKNEVILQGRREEDDLLEFISRFLPERVITLWPGNYDKWVKGERHTWDSVG